jgi:hypothetical protein
MCDIGKTVSATLYVSHINYENTHYKERVYTKDNYSNTVYHTTIYYPIYNTHLSVSDYDIFSKAVYEDLTKNIGHIIKSVELIEKSPSYLCVVVKVEIQKDHWETDYNYSVFEGERV